MSGKLSVKKTDRRMPRRLIGAFSGVILIVAGLVSWPLAAQAYTVTGCRWDHSNITYHYDYNGVNPTSFASGWNAPTDVNLTGTTTGGPIMNAYALDNGANGLAGTTYYLCPFALFTYDNVTVNPYYYNGYSNDNKRKVWLHEFGHGLGLDHAANTSAIMWHIPANVPYTTPQPDDIAGVNALY